MDTYIFGDAHTVGRHSIHIYMIGTVKTYTTGASQGKESASRTARPAKMRFGERSIE
jgi:hypothetical protein